MSEDNVTALFSFSLLSILVTDKMDSAVLYYPTRGNVGLAITSPTGHGLAVEDGNISFLINGELVFIPKFRTLESL